MPSSLLNRNVVVSGRRTSVRLEIQMWDALAEIARREGRTAHDICSEVDRFRQQSTLTSGLRVYVLDYFRAAATRADRAKAGRARGADPGPVRTPAQA